jgi:cell division initiation protein
MRITPLDIRKQEFRKAMRGLDAEEVYAFLSTIGDEYEAILNDNKALRERLLELDDKVQEYRTMEKTLRDTLLTAERVTVEAKDNARREANLIIKEAQIEAEKALRDIKNEAMKLRQEVSQLRSQRESYLGRMKVIAESLLKFIEGVDEDFRSEDEAFVDQLPEEEEPKDESLLADLPAEHVDLFEVADEGPAEEEAKEAAASVESAAAAVAAAKEPAVERDEEKRTAGAPGVPPDMQTPVVTDTTATEYAPRREAPAATPNDDKAAPQNTFADTSRPSAFGEDTLSSDTHADTKATLADINAIIERMADGQKGILAESHTDKAGPQGTLPETALPPAREHSGTEYVPAEYTPAVDTGGDEFESIPPAPKPMTAQKPVPTTGYAPAAPSGGPTRGRDEGRVGGAWDRVPEVATVVEMEPEVAETERQPLASEPENKVPVGKDITSEISLDQIRRDLEKRISDEPEEGS